MALASGRGETQPTLDSKFVAPTTQPMVDFLPFSSKAARPLWGGANEPPMTGMQAHYSLGFPDLIAGETMPCGTFYKAGSNLLRIKGWARRFTHLFSTRKPFCSKRETVNYHPFESVEF